MEARAAHYEADASLIGRNIRRNLRTLLRWRDLTARDFAALLGWNESMISRRLNGRTEISATDVALFADKLDVDPGLFYKDPEDLISSRCYLEGLPALDGQQHLPGVLSPPIPRHFAVAV